MSCGCTSCFNKSCPEPVDVTIGQTFLSLADGDAVVDLEEHKAFAGTSLTLNYAPLPGYAVRVLVNGLLQSAGVHYTVDGVDGDHRVQQRALGRCRSCTRTLNRRRSAMGSQAQQAYSTAVRGHLRWAARLSNDVVELFSDVTLSPRQPRSRTSDLRGRWLLTPVACGAAATAPSGGLPAMGPFPGPRTQTCSPRGTAFGAGDGSTTFTLPDLRGEFVRA